MDTWVNTEGGRETYRLRRLNPGEAPHLRGWTKIFEARRRSRGPL
jgi:hypothetical protein